jgi:hypothetical protein
MTLENINSDVNLVTNGITFTFCAGEVSSVESVVSQNPDKIPIYGSGAMGGYVFNFDGAVKTITVTGVLQTAPTSRTSSGDVRTILAQKQWLESICAGNSNSITFNSAYESETCDIITGATSPYQSHFTQTKGVVATLRTVREEGKPDMLPYTLQLVIGDVI